MKILTWIASCFFGYYLYHVATSLTQLKHESKELLASIKRLSKEEGE